MISRFQPGGQPGDSLSRTERFQPIISTWNLTEQIYQREVYVTTGNPTVVIIDWVGVTLDLSAINLMMCLAVYMHTYDTVSFSFARLLSSIATVLCDEGDD